jgi:hypothetical protein
MTSRGCKSIMHLHMHVRSQVFDANPCVKDTECQSFCKGHRHSRPTLLLSHARRGANVAFVTMHAVALHVQTDMCKKMQHVLRAQVRRQSFYMNEYVFTCHTSLTHIPRRRVKATTGFALVLPSRSYHSSHTPHLVSVPCVSLVESGAVLPAVSAAALLLALAAALDFVPASFETELSKYVSIL